VERTHCSISLFPVQRVVCWVVDSRLRDNEDGFGRPFFGHFFETMTIKRRATLISLRSQCRSMNWADSATISRPLRTRFNQLIARIDLRGKTLVEASPDRKQNRRAESPA
jgi:hypothetical protein